MTNFALVTEECRLCCVLLRGNWLSLCSPAIGQDRVSLQGILTGSACCLHHFYMLTLTRHWLASTSLGFIIMKTDNCITEQLLTAPCIQWVQSMKLGYVVQPLCKKHKCNPPARVLLGHWFCQFLLKKPLWFWAPYPLLGVYRWWHLWAARNYLVRNIWKHVYYSWSTYQCPHPHPSQPSRFNCAVSWMMP